MADFLEAFREEGRRFNKPSLENLRAYYGSFLSVYTLVCWLLLLRWSQYSPHGPNEDGLRYQQPTQITAAAGGVLHEPPLDGAAPAFLQTYLPPATRQCVSDRYRSVPSCQPSLPSFPFLFFFLRVAQHLKYRLCTNSSLGHFLTSDFLAWLVTASFYAVINLV